VSTRPRIPATFVSHGAPTLPLEPADPTHVFLAGLAAEIGRPRAILCASAHWDAPGPAVTGTAEPRTIHDFTGFPPPLYALRYEPPGEPAIAARAVALLAAAGIACGTDPARGLDHGAWVPLSLAFPDADVPVVQLAVSSRRDARAHFALGQALAPLREEGVWIVGSGGATHNLGRMDWEAPPGEAPADILAFEEWLVSNVEAGETAALLDWETAAPAAFANHPTPEHFLPLFIALGAAGQGARGRTLHRAMAYGALSMDAFAWA